MGLFNPRTKPVDCQELTEQEIFVPLVNFLADIKNVYHIEYLYFNILYNTGARPEEPLQLDLWEVTGPDEIKLTTLKTGEIRTFTKQEVGIIFFNAVAEGVDIFDRYNYRYLLRFYKRHCPLGNVYRKNSSIQMYIFRHFKVKTLITQGFTKQEIITYFAWQEPNIYDQYAHSEICR